jgi:2-amino-4-hydroxy-6-hydroxymethyldihydropteridine diphosphokinase
MILIGLGANLPGLGGEPPESTIEAALQALEAAGIQVCERSPLFRSAPVPPSDQPWYINAVTRVETALDPGDLLAELHHIEVRFGRARNERWEARILDLDLLAYEDRVETGERPPVLPHPRLHERAFVLLPLAKIAPNWRHPGTGATLTTMIAALDPEARRSTVFHASP